MILGMVTVVLAHRAMAQDYTIDWHTVGGGGGSSAGGEFKLHGTIGQAIAGSSAGGTFKLSGGFLPGVFGATSPEPPSVPPGAEHRANKHRYLSIDPSTNAANNVAIKLELAEMKRCSGDLARACKVDDDCEVAVPGSGTCIQHADVGLSWWVQAPQQEPLGCLPGPCGDDDWFARVEGVPYFDTWTLSTLHIGDCQIIPVVTYEISACAPPDGVVCSDPLTIGSESLQTRGRVGLPHLGSYGI